MRNVLGGLWAGLLLLGSALAQAVAGPQVEKLFDLPLETKECLFDARHGVLYAALRERSAVGAFSLTNGTEQAAWTLSLTPDAMTLTPNGRWLYVTEVQITETGFKNDKLGKVAEIDLVSGALSRELSFTYSPRGILATDSRWLILTSPSTSDGGPEVRLYDTQTGATSPKLLCCELYGLSLDPSQGSFFLYGVGNRLAPDVRAFLDFGQVRISPLRRARDENMVAPVYPSPDGTLLLCGDAAYRGSTNALEDLRFVQMLEGAGGGVYVFDTEDRGDIMRANFTGLTFYRRDNLEMFRRIETGNTLTAAYYQDAVLAVVLGTGWVRSVMRAPNPALSLRTNQVPTARFTWTPAEPTTLQPIRFDGSSSSDDLDAATQLQYRWDLDHDGVFDTPYSNDPTTQFRLVAAGSHVVTLEVRDSFALTNCLDQTVEVRLETDPGQPGGTNTPWQLPFAAARVAFDSLRGCLYATDSVGRRLVRLNLTNGLVEHQWLFDMDPWPVILRPDGSRLYVGLTTNNPTYFDGRGSGVVAEFDPDKALKTKEFPVSMDPLELLATDSGFVIAYGEANPAREVQAYRVETGQRTGSTNLDQVSKIALHPSQVIIYAAAQDNPSTLQRFDLAPGTGGLRLVGTSSLPSGGGVFPLPNGTNVILGTAALVTSSTNWSRDLKFIRNLPVDGVEDVIALPPRQAGPGAVGLLANWYIVYLWDDSWTPAVAISTPLSTQRLGVYAGRGFEVSVEANLTSVRSRAVPALRPEDNQPPQVRLVSPTNNTVILAGKSVTLSADASDEDGVVMGVCFLVGTNLVEAPTNGPYQVVWTPPAWGRYAVVAVARDNLGATNTSAPATLIVNQPPTVTLLDPAVSGPLLSPATFSIEAIAEDVDGEIQQVDLLLGDEKRVFTPLATMTQPPYRVTVTNYVGSGGFLRAIATDNFGATKTATIALRLYGLAGDEFNRAFLLTGASARARAVNSTATAQAAEPAILPRLQMAPLRTLWWTWTAPSIGIATVSTRGSTFDTCLQVFRGTNLPYLGWVAENDDDLLAPPTSRCKFLTVSNVVYQVQVSSARQDEVGEVVLSLDFRVPATDTNSVPVNDPFANRLQVSGSRWAVEGSNRGATAEPSEPARSGLAARKSVWWEWVAPAAGQVTLTTENSDFDTVLAVYTGGPSVTSMQWVASNDDYLGALTSAVTFSATNDAPYYIAVDSYGGDEGTVRLALALETNTVQLLPPPNDNLAQAEVLTGLIAFGRANNTLATSELGEPGHGPGLKPQRSVWWTWTAPASVPVYILANGVGYTGAGVWTHVKLAIGVYQGDTIDNLWLVGQGAIDQTSPTSTAWLQFSADAGKVYRIALDSMYTASGDLELSLNATLLPGSLRLDLWRQPQPGTFWLQAVSSYPRPLAIDGSADLREWSEWKRFAPEAPTGWSVTAAELSAPYRFFRVRSLEPNP